MDFDKAIEAFSNFKKELKYKEQDIKAYPVQHQITTFRRLIKEYYTGINESDGESFDSRVFEYIISPGIHEPKKYELLIFFSQDIVEDLEMKRSIYVKSNPTRQISVLEQNQELEKLRNEVSALKTAYEKLKNISDKSNIFNYRILFYVLLLVFLTFINSTIHKVIGLDFNLWIFLFIQLFVGGAFFLSIIKKFSDKTNIIIQLILVLLAIFLSKALENVPF